MMKEPGDKAMFVERLLPAAREKLVTIADDARPIEALLLDLLSAAYSKSFRHFVRLFARLPGRVSPFSSKVTVEHVHELGKGEQHIEGEPARFSRHRHTVVVTVACRAASFIA
jgi:hypothetical protein